MAWSAEDRSWLEGRLEQHKCDIQMLFEQHVLKIKEGQTNFAPTPFTPAEYVVPTPMPTSLSKPMIFEESAQTPRSEATDAAATVLHHLVVDDRAQAIDPKSMRGRVASFLNSFMYAFVNVCVVANTVVMFVELQFLGSISNASLGIESHGDWSKASHSLPHIQNIFTAIFLFDLALQLYAFRLQYFRSRFNTVDSVIVALTTLEAFVLTPLTSKVGNVAVIRLLRLVRVTRALKAARSFKAFEGLRVLVAVMCFSFGSTLWSLLVLVIFQIMASIFMCESLHFFVIDSSNDLSLREWVNSMYGDGVKSFWTIFELTFSGCWPNYARRIIEEVHPLYSLFYFLYVYIVVFVVTRIVAALFVRETMTQYANDADSMVKERMKKSHWVRQSLSALFDEADTNRDGFLDIDEMRALFAYPKVKLWLTELGVDASDPDSLITLLDSGDGWKVNCDDFTHGISRLKGEARSQDLVPVYNHVKRILCHVKQIHKSLDCLAQQNATAGQVHV